MSKGSKLRPRSQSVTSTDFASNWDKAFKKKKPDAPIEVKPVEQAPAPVQLDNPVK